MMLGAYCWRKDWETLTELPPETRHHAIAWFEGLKEIREKSDSPSSRRHMRTSAVARACLLTTTIIHLDVPHEGGAAVFLQHSAALPGPA